MSASLAGGRPSITSFAGSALRQRHVTRHTRADHAGHRSNRLDQQAIAAQHVAGTRADDRRQRQDLPGIEAGIHGGQLRKALDEKAGRTDEHDGERDFRDDNRLAHAASQK